MVLKKKSLLSRKISENLENNFGVVLMSDSRQLACLESVKIGVHLWPVNIWERERTNFSAVAQAAPSQPRISRICTEGFVRRVRATHQRFLSKFESLVR